MAKRPKRTTLWLALACGALLLAIWQAQVAAKAGDPPRNKVSGPPVKTRHAVRPPPPAPGDAFATFATRAAKGLTDRQVGWITGDFKTAGLDLGIRTAPPDEYLAQRAAADRWYRDALVEAWNLDPSQVTEVTRKLRELFDAEKAEFLKTLESGSGRFEHEGKIYQLTGTAPIDRLLDAFSKLPEEGNQLMPAKLFTPPPGPKTAAQAEVPSPRSDLLPGKLRQVDALLPTAATPEIPPAASLLEVARTLHPARLKLLLLIDRELAATLLKQLDGVGN